MMVIEHTGDCYASAMLDGLGTWRRDPGQLAVITPTALSVGRAHAKTIASSEMNDHHGKVRQKFKSNMVVKMTTVVRCHH
jgi:hypothetical protein